jgi:hypothetical protein
MVSDYMVELLVIVIPEARSQKPSFFSSRMSQQSSWVFELVLVGFCPLHPGQS